MQTPRTKQHDWVAPQRKLRGVNLPKAPVDKLVNGRVMACITTTVATTDLAAQFLHAVGVLEFPNVALALDFVEDTVSARCVYADGA